MGRGSNLNHDILLTTHINTERDSATTMKNINTDTISDLLCDANDIRNALRFAQGNLLNKPKDNDDTETTIGDCLDNIIDTLEEIASN